MSNASQPTCCFCKRSMGVAFRVFCPKAKPFGTACASCEDDIEATDLYDAAMIHSLVAGNHYSDLDLVDGPVTSAILSIHDVKPCSISRWRSEIDGLRMVRVFGAFTPYWRERM